MTDIVRRASSGALRRLVDLIPVDLHALQPTDGDQRREICLLFADIADYSDFVAEAGDDAAMEVLEVLDDLLEAAIDRHPDARVVKRLGDGVMIVTAEPAAALDLAVGLVDGFTVRTIETGWPLRLRAGVHRGTVRRRDGDVFGYHVNLAARVAASARPGEVLTTAHAVAGVDLEALSLEGREAGILQAKGVTRPVTTFAVERVHGEDAHPEGTGRRPRQPLGLRLPRVPVLSERRSGTG